MPMTCGHRVAVGEWCYECGTVVDEAVVRMMAFHAPPPATIAEALARTVPPPRDPDIELFEDDGRILDCQGCEIIAGTILDVEVTKVIARPGAWSTCGNCGTQTTVLL